MVVAAPVASGVVVVFTAPVRRCWVVAGEAVAGNRGMKAPAASVVVAVAESEVVAMAVAA